MTGRVEGSDPWPWEKYVKKVVGDDKRTAWESMGYDYARAIVSLDGLEAMLERIAENIERVVEKLDEISDKLPKTETER